MNKMKAMGFTDTELETLSNQADQDIIEGRFTPTRQTNLPSLCKAVLLVMAQQRKKWVCAAELKEPLNEKGAELKTCRHLGDLLGNGVAGFMLASTTHYNPKKKNQRYYRIPDVDQFQDWFNDPNAVLPKEYYSEEELRVVFYHLRKRQLKSQKQEVQDA